MTLERAAADQPRERSLFDGGTAAIAQPFRGDECLSQSRRHDHVRKPQRREQHFGKRAEIDDALGAIERFQRGQRTRIETELAVVVVFDQPAVVMFGPRQQIHAAREAEHRAGRKLMRRRDQRNTRTVARQAQKRRCRRCRQDTVRFSRRAPGTVVARLGNADLP